MQQVGISKSLKNQSCLGLEATFPISCPLENEASAHDPVVVNRLWIEFDLPDSVLEDAGELILLALQEGQTVFQGHFLLIEVCALLDVLLLGASDTDCLPSVSTASERLAAAELVGEVADIVETSLLCTTDGEGVPGLACPSFAEVLLLLGVDIDGP